MSKPSLVIVHGSWHTPEHFNPLITHLENHNYKCVPVWLPSNQGNHLPPAGFSDDRTAIRTAIESEMDAGNNVVVVAHSYGGGATNNALEGFDARARSEVGASTAVLGIVFLCAIPLPRGTTFLEILGGRPGPIHDLRDENFAWVGEPGPGYFFYNDLDPVEANKWIKLLRPQSWAAYCEETTSAAYMEFRCAYLHTTRDNSFPYEAQKRLVNAAIWAGARIKTEVMDASHSPFLSQPEKTADFIRRTVNDLQA